ncbi:MAG: alpha-L-rhamnosidase, partial [Gammaproteobacteria bacterium]
MAGAPTRLRCEYLENPIGLGETQPILSWWLNDDRAAEVQTAYHVLAASAPRQLEDDQADVWDSGRVPSSETAQIAFGGGPLVSMQRVWWKVRSYDSDGVASEWSAPACFEMGLLDVRDWRAHWIGTPLMGSKGTPARVPLLRRSFELPQRIERARLYITAL